MKKRTVTTPELMFVIGTRAALIAGIALAGLGGVTTIPAVRMLSRRRSLLSRIGLAA